MLSSNQRCKCWIFKLPQVGQVTCLVDPFSSTDTIRKYKSTKQSSKHYESTSANPLHLAKHFHLKKLYTFHAKKTTKKCFFKLQLINNGKKMHY